MNTLNSHVTNMLRTWFAHGVFDRAAFANNDKAINWTAHAQAAERIEEGAITLLKNQNNLLLLDPDQPQDHRRDRSRRQHLRGRRRLLQGLAYLSPVTPLQGITARAGPHITIRYDDGSKQSSAVAAAMGADVALVFAANQQTEGLDQSCISLDCTETQDSLIAAVGLANPNTVVVVETGAPVLTPWRGVVPAILEAWYPGEEGGTAIARVLFGDSDPGGRLPATFPNSRPPILPTAGSIKQYPGNLLEQEWYSEGVLIGYRWYDHQNINPVFAFGSGLSYTQFSYSNLVVTPTKVSAVVSNVGKRSGTDTPQLYVGIPAPSAAAVEPPHQLKAFQKVTLAPGQSARVSFPLTARDFSYWDVNSGTWAEQAACCRIFAGSQLARTAAGRPGRPSRRPLWIVSSPGGRPCRCSLAAGPCLAQATGLVLTGTQQLDPRMSELTFTTPALAKPTGVRILLPAGYNPRGTKRYPVLYLLNGSLSDQTSWTEQGNAEPATAPYPVIVVMPDGGNGGYYSDWYNYGALGPPEWETYHIDQLIPWIDAHYLTIPSRSGRAIGGLSMGGFGAMSYAAWHPDLFVAAASFSGSLDTNDPPFIDEPDESAFDGGLPFDTWGPRLTQAVRWRGHNPWDLAENLRGLYLVARTGDGLPGPGFLSVDPTEIIVHEESTDFHDKLVELGIPHVWDDYGAGGHQWRYWDQDLIVTLPGIMAAFADPPPPPPSVNFTAVEASYEVYGWKVTMERPALEFSTLANANRGGFSLIGSGSATVVTPPVYAPNGIYKVRVSTYIDAVTNTAPKADGQGRLSIAVPLGPGNRWQEYTPEAGLTATSSYATRVTIASP